MRGVDLNQELGIIRDDAVDPHLKEFTHALCAFDRPRDDLKISAMGLPNKPAIHGAVIGGEDVHPESYRLVEEFVC